MSKADTIFKDMCRDIIENGTSTEGEKVRPKWPDGTPAYTIKKFGVVNRYDLSQEFPAITLRRTAIKSAFDEVLWIWQKKSNNIKDLKPHIWDEWADAEGDLGPVYGHQWRHFNAPWAKGVKTVGGVDQIQDVIERIKKNPQDRREIVCAWNPAQIDDMALPPCHCFFQFDVTPDGCLNCLIYQRSCDMFLGVPFNIASYSLLTMMVAQVCGLKAGEFVHTLGNAHIYSNHFEQVKLQLSRKPYPLPHMKINPEVKNIDDFRYEDFELVNYQCHPAIKGEVAV